MNTKMEDEIKRWTAKRKSALVLDIIQGKTTMVSEASRAYDLSPSEVEKWVDDAVISPFLETASSRNATRPWPDVLGQFGLNGTLIHPYFPI